MPAAVRSLPDRTSLVVRLTACGLVGVLTGLLGSAVHLARFPLLGVLVPHGILLAVALVVATDVAVAAGTVGRRRPGPGGSLLAVAAGRGLVIGVLLLGSTQGGDVVLTGLPASTAWILLSVLLPAFAAPMAVALGAGRRSGNAARTTSLTVRS